MVTHDGHVIPTFSRRWDPADKDWVWVAWDELLSGATISTSTWVLPAGWTEHETQTSQAITDEDGTEYTAANGALISNADAATGSRVEIANRVVLSDGREYERSAALIIAQQ